MVRKSESYCTTRAALLAVLLALSLLELARAAKSFVRLNLGRKGKGTAESKIIDKDGGSHGECVYVNDEGHPVKIKYKETSDGKPEAESDDESVTDPLEELEKCRKSVRVDKTSGKDTEEDQKKREIDEEKFKKEKDSFGKEMGDFGKKMEEGRLHIEDTISRQQ
nr:uncharacterized protein LOC123756848 [Procambarus clarkii]